MKNQRKHPAVKENVPGGFYVEEGCCTMCGVPHAEAPALFGGLTKNGKRTQEQCFVKKQPETGEELNQMINVMATQDLDCIRYSGSDQNIKARIIGEGEGNQIDWKE